MKATATIYQAALYMRLSKDDDGVNESASIGTQRKMLRSYARENGFTVWDEFIDDGYSGTNFDRPNFLRMIAAIEAGDVNMVITKDLSRLGREYIATGQYVELYFPEHGVRYIAVNDGYDSASPCNDIAPFKNVINEMYARDTSKKIRSALTTKMAEGSFIGSFAPYGYRKDPADKNHLLMDEKTAPVVQELFRMAECGHRPSDIAQALNQRSVATPADYRGDQRPYLDINCCSQRKMWTSATVCKMLRNVVYLGHMAQGKTTKVSFKSHMVLANDREDWFVVHNTHQPLVSQATFDSVRQRSVSRRNAPTGTFQNVFSGIAKCMDCGRNMSSTGTRKKGCVANLVCGGYKLYGSKVCSNHFIDYETLYNTVLGELQKQVCITSTQRQDMLDALTMAERRAHTAAHKNLAALERRAQSLDKIVQQLYEDHVGGKVSDARFAKLLAAYEVEQTSIWGKIEGLTPATEDQALPLQFYKSMDEIANLQTLTTQVLHKLIDHIEIGQGSSDASGHKHQAVRIFFRFSAHGPE